MERITPEHYRLVAHAIEQAVGSSEFFSGAIECDDGPFRVTMRLTLIIRRAPSLGPDDAAPRATEIIPVWWEHHLDDICGERLTDFSWHELKKYLK